MKLRPHHLLCTQAYGGRGYDDGFTANMTSVTNRLRGEADVQIDIVFGTDDICEKCPHRIAADVCRYDDKVKRYDAKVIAYFGIEEKRCIYRDIIDEINAKMTVSMMDDICSGCHWYATFCAKRVNPSLPDIFSFNFAGSLLTDNRTP